MLGLRIITVDEITQILSEGLFLSTATKDKDYFKQLPPEPVTTKQNSFVRKLDRLELETRHNPLPLSYQNLS